MSGFLSTTWGLVTIAVVVVLIIVIIAVILFLFSRQRPYVNPKYEYYEGLVPAGMESGTGVAYVDSSHQGGPMNSYLR